MTAADCLELRSNLAEHAVSSLPEPDRSEVERHLEWCAGCRKEARELQEGAATAGLSLTPAEPPERLEERVVAGVQRAASRGRPSRRPMYVRRAVTVLAAAIGILGIAAAGTLLAQRQTANEATRFARQQEKTYQQKFDALLLDLRRTGGVKSHISQAVLRPPDGSAGVGGAIRVTSTSPRFPEELVVLVTGLDSSRAPYRVWLVKGSGKAIMIPAYMPLDNVGAGQLLLPGRVPGGALAVEVRDAKGHVALTGSFPRGP